MSLLGYPKPLHRRTGNKVSWAYYATAAEAKTCSEAAKANAEFLATKGYDFGYQAPGKISRPYTREGFYINLYEVVLP